MLPLVFSKYPRICFPEKPRQLLLINVNYCCLGFVSNMLVMNKLCWEKYTSLHNTVPDAAALSRFLSRYTSYLCVTYKLATVCYKARSTSTPASLQSLLVLHVPSQSLQSSLAPRLAVPRNQAIFSSHYLSLHWPFGAYCRTMSSTRTPWQLLKSDWKLTFFTASCENFLPPSASAFLFMALYKFYHYHYHT